MRGMSHDRYCVLGGVTLGSICTHAVPMLPCSQPLFELLEPPQPDDPHADTARAHTAKGTSQADENRMRFPPSYWLDHRAAPVIPVPRTHIQNHRRTARASRDPSQVSH
jgi:hypothetical protein